MAKRVIIEKEIYESLRGIDQSSLDLSSDNEREFLNEVETDNLSKKSVD